MVASGGPGLVDSLYLRAEKNGVEIVYEAWVKDLIHDSEGVKGVLVRLDGKEMEIRGASVVLACGGFEADAIVAPESVVRDGISKARDQPASRSPSSPRAMPSRASSDRSPRKACSIVPSATRRRSTGPSAR